jgi:hypothetical protein
MCAMIPMLRVFSSVTLRGMSFGSVLPISGRKKARSGPGAACGACPEKCYVVVGSIDLRDRPLPRA